MEDQTTLGCIARLIKQTEKLSKVIEEQQIIIDQLESQIKEFDDDVEERSVGTCKVIPLKCC